MTARDCRIWGPRSAHCDFVRIIEPPACVTIRTGMFSRKMMKKSFFQKQSIGFAPLASVRDCVMVAILVAGMLGLREAILLWSPVDTLLLRSMLIGACAGMLPSILMCLPVHGVVDDLSRDAFHSFLKAMKFVRHVELNGTHFYTYDTPAWMRWDSNRVTIKSLPNGQLSVSMPFYCYRVLKQWS